MNKLFGYTQAETEELISIATSDLKLEAKAVVEKDLYLTKALRVLSQVEDDNFKLIFQGGTALAKAYKIVNRMSEDCDFRVAYKVPSADRNTSNQRTQLRSLRKKVISALVGSGFLIQKDDVEVRNNGQYVELKVGYEGKHHSPTQLKPYIALDLFHGKLKCKPVRQEITSLIRETLGDQIKHPTFKLSCMSPVETAAEKWVSLTRRVATMEEKTGYDDQHIVRHLYDLHAINSYKPLCETNFAKLAAGVVSEDRIHFKTHSDTYHNDTIAAINLSSKDLAENKKWSDNWKNFLETMVYGEKPTYKQVIDNLNHLTALAVPEVKKELSKLPKALNENPKDLGSGPKLT